jgi:hypothetical protein
VNTPSGWPSGTLRALTRTDTIRDQPVIVERQHTGPNGFVHIQPSPRDRFFPDNPSTGSTLLRIADFKSEVFKFGHEPERVSRAAPATCGVAIDVPL